MGSAHPRLATPAERKPALMILQMALVPQPKRTNPSQSQPEALGELILFPKSTPPQSFSFSACTVCRRLKMKCVGAEQGPPCKRCLTGNHECVFEESNRGKRSSKYAHQPFMPYEILTTHAQAQENTSS